MPPDLIAGRYRVVRPIGSGSMGTVWLCRDEVLNREVAVKQIGLLAGESSVRAARAMREARSGAALQHENAVSIFDVVEDQGAPWLVMEYVDGRSLAEELDEHGPMSPERVAVIGAQLADALAGAHGLGFVHRDIKPGNVLLADDDHAKISDFGITRHDTDEALTQTGLMTGTPAYFSPELARGGDPSRASDVWALGATLYTAVEGRTPYEAQANPINMLRSIDTSPPRPVQRAGPMRPVLAGLLDPDPDRRWTMREAAQRLRDVSSGRGPAPVAASSTQVLPRDTAPAPAPAPAPPSRGRDRRQSRLLTVAALALLALVVGVGAYLLFGGPDPAAQTPTADQPSQEPASSPSQEASPSPTQQPTPEESPQQGSATVTEEEIDGFLTSYFGRLPDDTDGGWEQLAPTMQQEVGREQYEDFWDSMDAVEVSNIEANADELTATIDITYFFEDGEVSEETQLLDLQRGGEGLLIAGDEVLSSRTR